MKSAYGKLEKLKSLFITIFFLFLVIEIGLLSSYFSFGGKPTSQEYILSAIFQGMAAIFALTLTGVLVISQMLANTYSHRVIKYFFNKWSLFFLIVLYLVSMFYPLMLLNNLSPDSTIDRVQMAQVMSIAVVSVAFSGIFIYFMLISLRPQTVFEFLKRGIKKEIKTQNLHTNKELDIEEELERLQIKDEKIEESFQAFSEIIIRSIYVYDIDTLRTGTNAFTETIIDTLFSGENENGRTAKIFSEHFRTQMKIAKKQENGLALIEIAKNINKILLAGYEKGNDGLVPYYFSVINKEILSDSKDKDILVFEEIIDSIRDFAMEVPKKEAKLKIKSYYLKELLSPLCEVSKELLKEFSSNTNFEKVRTLEHLMSALYIIAKEYVDSGKKELEEAIECLTEPIEEYLRSLVQECDIKKYGTQNYADIFKEFQENLNALIDIAKFSLKNNMPIVAQNILAFIISLLDSLEVNHASHLTANIESPTTPRELITNLDFYIYNSRYDILHETIILCFQAKIYKNDKLVNKVVEQMTKINKENKKLLFYILNEAFKKEGVELEAEYMGVQRKGRKKYLEPSIAIKEVKGLIEKKLLENEEFN